jgi:hypothetical protein
MKETKWYIDVDTDQIVCFCEPCGAEARCTKENPEEFRFAHKDSCPNSDEKRVQRLVDAMTRVLGEETDNHVAFSAVTFLSASMCAVAAEESGVPVDIMARRFVRVFEQRICDVGFVMQSMLSKQNNAA